MLPRLIVVISSLFILFFEGVGANTVSIEQTQGLFKKAIQERTDKGNYMPSQMLDLLYDFSPGLYQSALVNEQADEMIFCKLKQLGEIEAQLKSLNASISSYCALDAASFLRMSCTDKVNLVQYKEPCASPPQKIFENLYLALSNYSFELGSKTKVQKASSLENASASPCKEGLVRQKDYRKFNQCGDERESCQKNADCCSRVCQRKVGASEGSCALRITCYKKLAPGATCGQLADGVLNYNCQRGACQQLENPAEGSKCMVCSQKGERPSKSSGCCPGLYPSVENKCIPIVKPAKVTFFDRLMNFILPRAFAQECMPGVSCAAKSPYTPKQQEVLEMEFNNCLRDHSVRERQQECLDKLDELKRSMLEEDSGAPETGQQTTHLELDERYSDVKRCEFNSYLDTFKELTAEQINRELDIRAFEYVYSGQGTQDYWLDARGESLFKRLQVVADELRENRAKAIESFKLVDEKMTCKCLAVFGAEKFSDEKQNFFKSPTCAPERAKLAASGSNEKILSINQRIAKIDQGAAGLSHQALLLDWLIMAKEAQDTSFNSDAMALSKLNEILAYMEEVQWHAGTEYPVKLYEFTVRRPTTFFRIVSMINPLVGLGNFLFTRSNPRFYSPLLTFMSVVKGNYKDRLPEINNKPKGDEVCTNLACTHKKQTYEKIFMSKQYQNFRRSKGALYDLSATAKPRCDIMASASQCIQNVFALGNSRQFLLDIKNPLFVDFPASMLKGDYVNKMNQAYRFGLQKLRSTKPDGVVTPDFLERNFMEEEEYLKAFTVNNGAYLPPKFSDNYKEKFIAGATKFIMCDELSKCGAPIKYKGHYGLAALFTNETTAREYAGHIFTAHFIEPSLTEDKTLGYPLVNQLNYLTRIKELLLNSAIDSQSRSDKIAQSIDKTQKDWEARKKNYDDNGDVHIGNSKNVGYSKEVRDTLKLLNFSTGEGLSAFTKSYNKLLASSNLSEKDISALKGAKVHAQNLQEAFSKKKNFDQQVSAKDKAYASRQSAGLLGGRSGGALGAISSGQGKLGALSESAPANTQKSAAPVASSFGINTPSGQNFARTQNHGIGNFGVDYESGHDAQSANGEKARFSEEFVGHMLQNIQNDKSLRKTEGDGLFLSLSKAYKRNYHNFFTIKKRSRAFDPPKEDNETQKKLKVLLGQ